MLSTAVYEEHLVELARAGDENALAMLVRRYSPALLRLARMYVPSEAVAEDVVQDTWIGVLRGLERFERRSSFKTWLFRILVFRARTCGARENRTVPFASLGPAHSEERPSWDVQPFLRDGAWGSTPRHWEDNPETALQFREALELVKEAVDALPERQRLVITLRIFEGRRADEVRNLLDVSANHERVLLHRARTKVRMALESWVAPA